MPEDPLHCHPRDIAAFALRHIDKGTALVFVTATEGGSVRAPGLRMAVRADGATIGFMSNGCVEADVAAVAVEAIREQRFTETAYGRGSGKIDIVLPCGGRVDVAIVPVTAQNSAGVAAMIASGRHSGTLAVGADGGLGWNHPDDGPWEAKYRFAIHPKIRLVVAGAGTEALIVCRLAAFADMEVEIISPDRTTLASAAALGIRARELRGLASQVVVDADAFTAVALLFHDHEWEALVLVEALKGPAFYVGALGSRRAHAKRLEKLSEMGCDDLELARIKAPIGLIHQLREPNLLAASVLAEIAGVFSALYISF